MLTATIARYTKLKIIEIDKNEPLNLLGIYLIYISLIEVWI
tara:strand:+ start:131 stop:253 length:123 start_codon:yes stop_codon:yes gene_type:complete